MWEVSFGGIKVHIIHEEVRYLENRVPKSWGLGPILITIHYIQVPSWPSATLDKCSQGNGRANILQGYNEVHWLWHYCKDTDNKSSWWSTGNASVPINEYICYVLCTNVIVDNVQLCLTTVLIYCSFFNRHHTFNFRPTNNQRYILCTSTILQPTCY